MKWVQPIPLSPQPLLQIWNEDGKFLNNGGMTCQDSFPTPKLSIITKKKKKKKNINYGHYLKETKNIKKDKESSRNLHSNLHYQFCKY